MLPGSLVVLVRSFAFKGARFLSREIDLLYSVSRTVASSTMPSKKPFSRLPKNVKPENYKLRLIPNLGAFTFTGSETISVEVTEPTTIVKLNCADIKVLNANFVKEEGGEPQQAVVQYGEGDDEEMLTLQFTEKLAAGSGYINMEFQGELNDKMKGFYRSKYLSPSGEERYGAVTQFEATDARRAFPCWDEPAIKATFDVTLCVPKDRVALSNMPVASEEESKVAGCKEVTYGRTPVMSTYLLAFIVGEYDYVEGKDSDGVLIRVYTPLGKAEQGRYALEVAEKTLPFYKDYFNIAYPLPKMDLIAIADFAAGAMENWGLVTYREQALLVDPRESSAGTKQIVCLVVGHELAHQWFGNLVTMEWWTHLWLNEGFASWIEYLCVDHCFPEYDIWTQFVTSDYTRALELDALRNSHPIEVPVGHPDEVDEIFDAISYSKGASAIRMLHQWIGDKDFRTGMHAYLTKHSYGNTFTEDLWEALETASGKPVTKMMNTWTKQMGYPVLKVSSEPCGDRQRKVTISQRKFCADGDATGCGDGEEQLWVVPVTVSTAASPDAPVQTALLEGRSLELVVDNVAPSDWIKLNVGTVGVYRTQYSAEMLELLLPAVKSKQLPPRDRLGLENDLFALAVAGEVSTVEVLKLVAGYAGERDYTVWNDVCTNLSTLSTLLQYTDYHHLFRAYTTDLLANIHDTLGWKAAGDKESHLDVLLRTLVLSVLGKNGHKGVIEESKKRFAAHCDKSSVIPADLRNPVYLSVLSSNDEAIFDQMLKLIAESDLQEEKSRIMRTLGAASTEPLIKRALDFALSESVRAQDTVFVLAGCTRSALGRDMTWRYVRDHFPLLLDRYKGFLLARLIMMTTENFASTERANEVEKFFLEHPTPAAERTIKQSLENIRLNEAWLRRDRDAIKAYLSDSQRK